MGNGWEGDKQDQARETRGKRGVRRRQAPAGLTSSAGPALSGLDPGIRLIWVRVLALPFLVRWPWEVPCPL